MEKVLKEAKELRKQDACLPCDPRLRAEGHELVG